MQAVANKLLNGRLASELTELWERTGTEALRRLAEGRPPREGMSSLPEPEQLDWTSTVLMDCYKDSGDPQVFGLLYELNEQSFLQAISYRLRRCMTALDARDVLQEVFLNIYRYPHRFLAEKSDSFRNWGHRIVRNTLLKNLKGESRRSRLTHLDEDLSQRADCRLHSPARIAEEAENAVVADRAYLLYLNLYLAHFNKLSAKERRALTLVEIDGRSYKASAADLGIRLENLKMVIFRGRRKILRGMSRSLTRLDLLGVPALRRRPTPRAAAPTASGRAAPASTTLLSSRASAKK